MARSCVGRVVVRGARSEQMAGRTGCAASRARGAR